MSERPTRSIENIGIPLVVIDSTPNAHQCRDCNTLILARESHLNLPHGRYHISCVIRILEALK